MNKTMLICALSSSIPLLGAAEINVSVCNLGQVPDTVVTQAEDEAAGVFHSIGVEVVWHGCGEGPVAQEAATNHWFTCRILPFKSSLASQQLVQHATKAEQVAPRINWLALKGTCASERVVGSSRTLEFYRNSVPFSHSVPLHLA